MSSMISRKLYNSNSWPLLLNMHFMNNRHRYLAKSNYKIALECPAKLFYTHKKDECANLHQKYEFLIALAEGDFQVGELDKYYHPG